MPLEAAERFLGGLALGALALVVAAAVGPGVADLGDGHHVQRVVDPAVPGAGQAVADLVAGGRVDRGGAVVAGELVLGGEPCHVAGFGQDPARDHRADTEQAGQRGARRGHESADLSCRGLQPRVERPDVGQVVLGELQADPRDVIAGPDPGQQSPGLARRQLAAHPAGSQLGEQAVQPGRRPGSAARTAPPAGRTAAAG